MRWIKIMSGFRKSFSTSVEVSEERRQIIADLLGRNKEEITQEFIEKEMRRETIVSGWRGPSAKHKTAEQAIAEAQKLKISR